MEPRVYRSVAVIVYAGLGCSYTVEVKNSVFVRANCNADEVVKLGVIVYTIFPQVVMRSDPVARTGCTYGKSNVAEISR